MLYITVWGTPIFADINTIIDKLRQETEYMRDKKVSNNTILVTCLFHKDGQESTPSLAINKKPVTSAEGETIPPGTVHCFGCGYSNDLAEFISDVFGKEDKGRFGYKWLVKNFVTGEYQDRKIDISISREKEYTPEISVDKFGFDHRYLKSRGISKKLMYQYNIRYNEKSNSVIFPVYDFDDRIIGYQEKFIDDSYYNSVGETDFIFGLQYLKDSKEIWITEGPLDALSCIENGKNAISFLGSPSKKQAKILDKLPYRTIMSALDNDSAGDKGHKFIKNNINNKFIKRVYFKGGNDPNDIVNNFNYSALLV